VSALRAAERLPVSLVAANDDELLGHVAFSPVTLESAASGLGLGIAAIRWSATYIAHGSNEAQALLLQFPE
jgi:predicted N-acetyltransferase YhbS